MSEKEGKVLKFVKRDKEGDFRNQADGIYGFEVVEKTEDSWFDDLLNGVTPEIAEKLKSKPKK
jgi:hypothetical protein